MAPKRVRASNYLLHGMGDGSVNTRGHTTRQVDNEMYRAAARKNVRGRERERLSAQQALEAANPWENVYFRANSPSGDAYPSSHNTPWQVQAFAILGAIVILTALFLHLLAATAENNSLQRRRRRRSNGTRAKKTDELVEDTEEELLSESVRGQDRDGGKDPQSPPFYLSYRSQQLQQHRHRKMSSATASEAVVASSATQDYTGSGFQHRNYYLNQSGSAVGSYNRSPKSSSLGSSTHSTARSATESTTLSQRGARPTNESSTAQIAYATSGGESYSVATSTSGYRPPVEVEPPTVQQQQEPPQQVMDGIFAQRQLLNARVLSDASSFGSIETPAGSKSKNVVRDEEIGSPIKASPTVSLQVPTKDAKSHVLLQPGTDDHEDSTPKAGHDKPRLTLSEAVDRTPIAGNRRNLAMRGPGQSPFRSPSNVKLSPPGQQESKRSPTLYPYVPSLESPVYAPPPPRSINIEDLHLYQLMESGNISHWEARVAEESRQLQNQVFPVSLKADAGEDITAAYVAESLSSSTELDSDDPRKSIVHKRDNLMHSTDAAASLQGAIDFKELALIEVIGGGGFGQVWRAMWRGTPVAVKVLTGKAQSTRVPKAVLEEFAAEINLLKGMRHPNICLYMGACLEPPNRAIVTELAANGSLWDALRLPLAPPFLACDGVSRDGWPLSLYEPDPRHGVPPSTVASRPQPATPPKGTWPWMLVKRVACGAARGMAYLHSGKPPILHRDLKSANILLDESYTPKVCDFGLSRLKAQERSMTGNCGTVQWMAPEVLANTAYNEKADVYSYGIICWELLSRQCPYDGMTPIQCALAVLNRNQRPEIPKWCPPSLNALIRSCVKKNPDDRPTFEQILLALDTIPEQ